MNITLVIPAQEVEYVDGEGPAAEKKKLGVPAQRVPVTGPVTIGRADTCTLKFALPGLSRNHCQIDSSGTLSDLKSRNGTFHTPPGGSRKQVSEPVVLEDQTLVEVSGLIFTVVIETTGAPTLVDAAATKVL